MTEPEEQQNDRRDFLVNAFMLLGLAISHLLAGVYVLRFLYPVKDERKRRLFVGLRREMPPGSAKVYTAPSGETINVVHGSEGFIALSTVCPHLGCKVHWDSLVSEFVCPCHNGHFDATGAPVSGPPADAGTPLSKFTVVTDNTSVYINLAAKS